MPQQTCNSEKWPAYIIFVLVLSLASEGAILSSGSQPTSTSITLTPKQRSARWAAMLDPRSRQNRDPRLQICSSDFVEQFFRLLSGPVGKEAEAVVAAVLKMLAENDRVNWPSMADANWLLSTSRDFLLSPQRLFTSKRHFQPQNSPVDPLKRLQPKFNPTGWRRKRDTEMNGDSFQRFLRRIFTKLTAPKPRGTAFPKLAEKSEEDGQQLAEWTNKRESLRRVLERLPKKLKPKRRPLEFNPTGW